MTIAREVLTPFNAHLDLNTLAVLQIPLHKTLGQSWKKNSVWKLTDQPQEWRCARDSSKFILICCTLHTLFEYDHVFYCVCPFLQLFVQVFPSRYVSLWISRYFQTGQFERRALSFDIAFVLWERCFCNPRLTKMCWNKKLQIVGKVLL